MSNRQRRSRRTWFRRGVAFTAAAAIATVTSALGVVGTGDTAAAADRAWSWPTSWPTFWPTSPPTSSPTATAPTSTPSSTTTTTSTPTATPSATSSATTPAGYTTRTDWANSVLTELNAERRQNNLPALRLNTKLNSSAGTHNQKMAQANTLSHQLSGEAGLGDRITTAGYRWRSCGENIAWNSNRSEAGVLAVQRSMYNETPPNDGHRRNILSTSFTEVGISVIDDAVHRRVWLTTDFGLPR